MIHADARTQLMTALSAQVKEVSIFQFKKPSKASCKAYGKNFSGPRFKPHVPKYTQDSAYGKQGEPTKAMYVITVCAKEDSSTWKDCIALELMKGDKVLDRREAEMRRLQRGSPARGEMARGQEPTSTKARGGNLAMAAAVGQRPQENVRLARRETGRASRPNHPPPPRPQQGPRGGAEDAPEEKKVLPATAVQPVALHGGPREKSRRARRAARRCRDRAFPRNPDRRVAEENPRRATRE